VSLSEAAAAPELAPIHSITSSARASSLDGTATHGRVVVIAAAALRGLGKSPRL